MRNGFLTSVGSLVVWGGLSLAQAPESLPLPPTAGMPPGAAAATRAEEVASPVLECLAEPLCLGRPAPEPRFWFRPDYLLWWIKDAPSSFPLATTSPPASLGIPGNPGTTVLFGGSDFEYGMFSGLRLSAGAQNSPAGLGLAGHIFLLESRATGASFTADRAGVPFLASPIISPTTGQLTSSVANNQNLLTTGFAGVSAARFWGGEANVTAPSFRSGCSELRLRGGFRYLDLAERLDIENALFSRVGAGTIVTGSTVDQVEGFHTRNQFYGGQVGAQGEFRFGRINLNVNGSVALGASHEVVAINGTETITAPSGAQATEASALLAMPTNNGRSTRDVFAVVPEVGVAIEYEVLRNVRVSVGYTFLYWSDVARPADQIDPVVNTRFRAGVGPARPAPLFNHTDFWAQGINLGATFRY